MKACRDCQFFIRQGEHYGQCKRLGAMKHDAGGYLLDSPSMLIMVQDDLHKMVELDGRDAALGVPQWGYVTVAEFFLCAYFCAVDVVESAPRIVGVESSYHVAPKGQRDAKQDLDSTVKAVTVVFHDFGWPIGEQRYKARVELGDDIIWIEPSPGGE